MSLKKLVCTKPEENVAEDKKRRRRRKEWKFEDFKYILELPERLAVHLRTLLQLDNAAWTFALNRIKQGDAYKEYSKSKGPGKGRRHFAVPCDELKLVQKAIDQKLLSQIPVHFSRHGYRLGSSIITNAEQHAGFAKSVLAIDIMNAYPSVYRSRIKANLRKPFIFILRQFQGREFSEDDIEYMLNALVDLVCLHDRLPEGPPTSPRLFNLVCMKMDKDIWEYCIKSGTPIQEYRYTAYSDNITISSNGEFPPGFKEKALEIIKENRFFPHDRTDKTRIMSPKTGEVPVVTGIVINADGRLTMAPRKLNQLRARLHHYLGMPAWTHEDFGRAQATLAYIRLIYPRKLPSRIRDHAEQISSRIEDRRSASLAKRCKDAPLPVTQCPNILFSDGACKGNPGPAAIGAVLTVQGTDVVEISQPIGLSTNVQAEYAALIAGLAAAVNRKLGELTCYLDNELIVQQLNGERNAKLPKLRALHAKVLELAADIGHVQFVHIPREQNSRADALANKALQSPATETGSGTDTGLAEILPLVAG
ncbi:MAG: reverse transcriptase-like protein [Patescibacteria group bacterium]